MIWDLLKQGGILLWNVVHTTKRNAYIPHGFCNLPGCSSAHQLHSALQSHNNKSWFSLLLWKMELHLWSQSCWIDCKLWVKYKHLYICWLPLCLTNDPAIWGSSCCVLTISSAAMWLLRSCDAVALWARSITKAQEMSKAWKRKS